MEPRNSGLQSVRVVVSAERRKFLFPADLSHSCMHKRGGHLVPFSFGLNFEHTVLDCLAELGRHGTARTFIRRPSAFKGCFMLREGWGV